MKIACLVVLGMLLTGGWTASAQGVMGGVGAPVEDPYKGPMGTKEHPVIVSAGVMAGLLISKPEPKYPADAKEASGVVIMVAKVGKAGNVVDLKVISGPVVLRDAALEAGRQWRYQLYLVNGKPVFVQTTITMNFPSKHNIF